VRWRRERRGSRGGGGGGGAAAPGRGGRGARPHAEGEGRWPTGQGAEVEGRAREGKRARPGESWFSPPWKTKGLGPWIPIMCASKCRSNLPRVSKHRGLPAPGKDRDLGGVWSFQTRPAGATPPSRAIMTLRLVLTPAVTLRQLDEIGRD